MRHIMHICRPVKSEVRSRGGSTLLAALLLICAGCPPRSHDLHIAEEHQEHPNKLHKSYQYYDTEDGRVKHGLYVLADDDQDPSTIVECGHYVNGLKEGLWAEYYKYRAIWSFYMYEHEQPVHLDVYNRSLLRVSSLEFRDGAPWNGTRWLLSMGLSEEGIVAKECAIETYKHGKLVDRVPCDLSGNPVPPDEEGREAEPVATP